MKMLCFKFHQNRTINEEFDYFEGEGGGIRPHRTFLKSTPGEWYKEAA